MGTKLLGGLFVVALIILLVACSVDTGEKISVTSERTEQTIQVKVQNRQPSTIVCDTKMGFAIAVYQWQDGGGDSTRAWAAGVMLSDEFYRQACLNQ